MKLGIVLLFLSATQVTATTVHSQEMVTMDLQNTKLATVLKTIQKKSDYRFVFSNEIIDNRMIVSLKAEHASVLEILPKILKGTGLEFEKLGEKLIIIRQDPKANAVILVKGTVTNAGGE